MSLSKFWKHLLCRCFDAVIGITKRKTLRKLDFCKSLPHMVSNQPNPGGKYKFIVGLLTIVEFFIQWILFFNHWPQNFIEEVSLNTVYRCDENWQHETWRQRNSAVFWGVKFIGNSNTAMKHDLAIIDSKESFESDARHFNTHHGWTRRCRTQLINRHEASSCVSCFNERYL